jgi:hypothetical protein
VGSSGLAPRAGGGAGGYCDDDLLDCVITPLDHLSRDRAWEVELRKAVAAGELASYTVIESPDPFFVAFIYLSRIRYAHLRDEIAGQHGVSLSLDEKKKSRYANGARTIALAQDRAGRGSATRGYAAGAGAQKTDHHRLWVGRGR